MSLNHVLHRASVLLLTSFLMWQLWNEGASVPFSLPKVSFFQALSILCIVCAVGIAVRVMRHAFDPARTARWEDHFGHRM